MRLFLIDGAALAYRSHFSFIRNPLINRRGMHTSAIFGFTSTIFRLLEKEDPEHIAVVFDSPEKTFRHEKYPDYKATREKMPEELAEQLPYLQQVVEAMHIPYLVKPTFEADDIIGTLARQAENDGIETFMVSGDKDFLQLVTPKIHLYNMKKGSEVEIENVEGPVKKWGVKAEYVTDFLALMGDSSDNVPGVPGIGPKGAAKLILEHGSLDDIYKNIEDVKPEKLRVKLLEHKDMAYLCKELVTIDTHVPMKISVEELKRNGMDVPRLTELFQDLEFQSLIDKLPASDELKVSSDERHYENVTTLKALKALAKNLTSAGEFAFDTETTSLNTIDARLVGLSFSFKKGEAFYVPGNAKDFGLDEIRAILGPLLRNPKLKKGGQNVKYDRAVLKNEGIDVDGITFDTMLESYLLDPSTRGHDLDSLALKHLGLQKIPTSELIGKGKNQISMLEVDGEKVSEYACEDADVTWQLHELFKPKLVDQGLEDLYQNVELPLASILGDLERKGFKLDVPFLKKLSESLDKNLQNLTVDIYKEAGEEFNLNSPKQLGALLFEKLKIQDELGIQRVKKTKTGYATDHDTMEKYAAHPIVNKILEYRVLAKLKSTYVDALPALVHPKTGRIHSSFNQTIAATGRLSSSNPNLQNIPIRTELGREIRKAFIPGEKDWVLISADYSQIELRILAHLCKDKTFIDAFKKNEDIHTRTASVIFGVDPEKVDATLRSRAKAINFGILYGMGPQRLARETGISLQEAKDFIGAYFEKYSRVKEYLESQVLHARDHGFVTTILGRRRPIPDIDCKNPMLVAMSERIATNTPIQGSAADLIKVAMIKIFEVLKKNKMKTRMLLQVHDELVFESPKDEVEKAKRLIQKGMEEAIHLDVPIKVEVGTGKNWDEAH